ncbi:DUF4259 domain-containing protein [Cryptosporangium aurantiacum]|uniref:DUF4259 domain-containing protein n=1 Tax=Cryptosporangium aurantiacum TaxID=134849 RepID=A0A1M7R2Q7_9ACTN|nr:DUF4259 domain-containing protein [Cryptosporangium aurantiacum]SHN39197.1 protein of unknown function [Cryptosporangium aurantiacum]
MGFWDASPFGNDDAADFALGLDDANSEARIEMVGAVLERVATSSLTDDLSPIDAPRAVAAAALVAAQCPGGKPVPSPHGPTAPTPDFPADYRRLALRALDRLVTEPSWMTAGWKDGGAAWRRTISDLRRVLDPPQAETLFEM